MHCSYVGYVVSRASAGEHPRRHAEAGAASTQSRSATMTRQQLTGTALAGSVSTQVKHDRPDGIERTRVHSAELATHRNTQSLVRGLLPASIESATWPRRCGRRRRDHRQKPFDLSCDTTEWDSAPLCDAARISMPIAQEVLRTRANTGSQDCSSALRARRRLFDSVMSHPWLVSTAR